MPDGALPVLQAKDGRIPERARPLIRRLPVPWSPGQARCFPKGHVMTMSTGWHWLLPDETTHGTRITTVSPIPLRLVPSNMTYPSSDASLTTPYEGKFCLQKAALKALSRRGWELIEPDEAFKPSWHYDYRYNPAYREEIYAPKTFKVRKYSAI